MIFFNFGGNFKQRVPHMKKEYLAGFIAAGLSAVAMTAQGEVISCDSHELEVFGAHPREIKVSLCESPALSLLSVQKMIQNRNKQDIDDVRSGLLRNSL